MTYKVRVERFDEVSQEYTVTSADVNPRGELVLRDEEGVSAVFNRGSWSAAFWIKGEDAKPSSSG